MTHSYVRHDSFICGTWLNIDICFHWHLLVHMCDMNQSYVWHDTFTCVKCRVHMCDMTRSYVWHKSCHTYERVMSHIWTRHVTHVKVSCLTYEWVMALVSHMWFDSCSERLAACMCVTQLHMCNMTSYVYGVATVSRIDKIIGLFCIMSSLL